MEIELILTGLHTFKFSHFGSFFLHCRVWRLCNQLLLQFSMDVSQNSQTYCRYIEDTDVLVGF